MGSGFKDFAAGDVLTANDVDGYLMRQTAMTFADASARDTALSGVLDEGMIAYLEDVNRYTFYDGSNWLDIVAGSSAGIWTAYTPSFTNLTVGNGTLSAAYCRVNDFVAVRVSLLFGSTTSMSGQPFFSLPVAATANLIQDTPLGKLRMLDAGSANYVGHVEINGSGVVGLYTNAVVNAPFVGRYTVNTVDPMTWTTNDTFWTYFTYRVA